MKTIKTKIHFYYFNLANEKDAKAYKDLKSELKSNAHRGHWLNALALQEGGHWTEEHGTSKTIELEVDNFITNNQWNTKCGQRVFDWCEDIYPNRQLKKGHYLEITQEMVKARKTLKCGYTGKLIRDPEAKENDFNLAAIGSKYLQEKDFPLLRLEPAGRCKRNYKKLTKKETEKLLQLQIKARLKHNEEDFKKEVQEEKDKIAIYEKNIEIMEWLKENDLPCDIRFIFIYQGEAKFKHQEDHIKEVILDKLVDAPFKWEFEEK